MRWLQALALVALVVTTCPAARAATTSEEFENFFSRFQGMLEEFPDISWSSFDSARVYGVVVVDRDSTIWKRIYSPEGRPATFRSILPCELGAPLFSLAVASRAARGQIDLDASLADLLPDIRLTGIDPGEVTLRDLLAGTHAIGDGGPMLGRLRTGDYTPELLVELARYHKPVDRTGGLRAGVAGLLLAQIAVERALGVSAADLVRTELLGPAGMNSTTSSIAEVEGKDVTFPLHMPPPSCSEHDMPFSWMLTTLDDVERFVRLCVNDGRAGTDQVVSSTALRSVRTTAREPVEPVPLSGDVFVLGTGLGWMSGAYHDEEVVCAGMGRAVVSFLPQRGIGVAFIVNDPRMMSFLLETGLGYVYDVLTGREASAATRVTEVEDSENQMDRMRAILADKSPAVPRDRLADADRYVGEYHNDLVGTMTVGVEGDSLTFAIGCARGKCLRSLDEDHGSSVPSLGRVRFRLRELGDVGSVVALEWEGQEFRLREK